MIIWSMQVVYLHINRLILGLMLSYLVYVDELINSNWRQNKNTSEAGHFRTDTFFTLNSDYIIYQQTHELQWPFVSKKWS